LRHILRSRPIAEETGRKADDSAEMAGHEGTTRFGVAGASAGNQSFIGIRRVIVVHTPKSRPPAFASHSQRRVPVALPPWLGLGIATIVAPTWNDGIVFIVRLSRISPCLLGNHDEPALRLGA